MKKKYLTIGDLRRNMLVLSAAAFLGLSACSTGTEGDWGSGTETAKQGVITELTEQENGEWKVTDERFDVDGQKMAILHHLDGRTDTLQGEALERGLNQQAEVQQGNTGFGGMGGLWAVLLLSRMGNTMGFRQGAPNPNVYANQSTYQRSNTSFRNAAPTSGRTGFFRNSGSPSGGGYTG